MTDCSLKDARAEGGLPAFPVLADPLGLTSAAYAAAMQMRIHTEWSNRPTTVVVDREGIVR